LDFDIWISVENTMVNMKKMRFGRRLWQASRGHSTGFTLIEVLIALALFGIIGIVFAGGLATASRAVLTGDVRTNSESLARTEMEYVKSQDYSSAPWSYVVTGFGSTPSCGECPTPTWFDPVHSLSNEHAGYTAGVQAEALDDPDNGIQKITVMVSHEGRTVITLEGYKVSR
jgi:prepilin-type N-terminal cleavage/methylation domain-containing protein